MKKAFKFSAVAGAVAASVFTSQAQPYVAGDFNGWNSSSSPMTGSPAGYTYVVPPGTGYPGSLDEFKVLQTGGFWNVTFPPNNVWTLFDSSGGNTFYYYPGPFSDGWYPLEDRVGYADPGDVSFELAGDFNGWNGGTPMVLKVNGIYTNTLVIPTPGTYGFKFRTPGTWNEAQVGTDFGENTGNASVTTTTPNEPVLFQLDLPNGRYQALVVPPVTNQVVFAVDMTSQIGLGAFNPATDSVFVSGDFNGSAGVWPGTGPGALLLTNRPSYTGDSDTNIYYGTNTFVGSPGTVPTNYKFTDNDPSLAGSNGYEQGGNRSFALLTTSGPLLLPVVSFGNYRASDYLAADTTVTFSVNMNGAHTAAGLSPDISPPAYFDGSYMPVYINGNFLDGGWISSWDSSTLDINGVQMTENPLGSGIYTFTYVVSAGQPVEVHYKFGFDDGSDSIDNEAPFQVDHVRIIRTPASGSYTMPTDTYGNQVVEPAFGQLTISPAAGKKVSVKWLGRPGLQLQSSSSPTGSWTNITGTDGNSWTGPTNATSNGTASVTNLPAGGKTGFFRLRGN
jgi:hypothetical protein